MYYRKLNDEDLLSHLTRSDKAAFEEIYRRYWYKLYCIAYHQIGVKEDSEEIVQDVFLSIWNRRESVEIKVLELYLTLSIKYKVYDFIRSQINYRKYKEHIILKEIDLHFNTDDIVNFSDLSDAVEKVLALLPEKSAAIFRKSRFENQNTKEIARQLNLSEKAVEYHITKSLRFLKDNLKDYSKLN